MSNQPTKFPSVLAFEKKLVPSDGYMYGTFWDKRTDQSTALNIKEKSVRGTISNRLSKDMENDHAKLDAEVEKPNLQTIDHCSLEENQDTLKLHFTLKILGNLSMPSACNKQDFAEEYKKVVQDYIETHGFRELAKRYAINLANARFLWRNRVGVEQIEVKITDLKSKEKYEFNALSYPLNDFDSTDTEIEKLAGKIAEVLSSEDDFLILDIETYAKIGKSQDVYPSEELVLDAKGKSTKSKILYSVNEVAAMHSQKIGNAIRTIDTWYHDDKYDRAIAIETYGAVTNLGKAFRKPKAKKDFYSIFDKWVMNRATHKPAEEDQHYAMAVLVRGGVFGKADDSK
jgi:CRISPR-associated protein Csy3